MSIVQLPLVTVITLTRNRDNLLPRAIKSVLNQSYKNIEYIIIDGASTDQTPKVVGSFNDPRIKYIKLESNLSHSLSYDLAFKNAQGEFITFLDDDDEYLYEKIEKQQKLLSSLPKEYGFVYCWMDYYDENKRCKVLECHPGQRGNIYYNQIEKQSIAGTPTLFIRRDALLMVGGLRKELQHASDWELVCRLARTYLVDYVPEVLVHVYVNHEYDRMSTFKMTDDKIISLIEFHEYFLVEFADAFSIYPNKQIPHFSALSKLYLRTNNFRKSWNYFVKLLNQKPNPVFFIRTAGKLVTLFIQAIIVESRKIFMDAKA